jgi:hypothetical protein
MDNNITLPAGVWIKIQEFNNGICAIDMSQFSPEVLENKELWISVKPSWMKNTRIIRNNYVDIQFITENIENDNNNEVK